jgi:hypothetical protein
MGEVVTGIFLKRWIIRGVFLAGRQGPINAAALHASMASNPPPIGSDSLGSENGRGSQNKGGRRDGAPRGGYNGRFQSEVS